MTREALKADQNTILTAELLARLESCWAKASNPILDGLRTGIGEDELRSSAEGLGVVLPHEACVWWGWHDGVEAGHKPWIAPNHQIISFERAIEQHQVPWPEGDGEEEWRWPETAFPIIGDNLGWLVIETAVPSNAPSPVYWGWTDDDPAELRVARAQSLGAVVSEWIRLYEENHIVITPYGRPEYVDERLLEDQWVRGLY